MDRQACKAGGMLRRDLILLAAAFLATLGVNLFVLTQALNLTGGATAAVLIAAFAASMAAVCVSVVEIARHLSRRKEDLYGEELCCAELQSGRQEEQP